MDFKKTTNVSGINSYQIGIQIPLIFNKERGKSKAAKLQSEITETNNQINIQKLNNQFKVQ